MVSPKKDKVVESTNNQENLPDEDFVIVNDDNKVNSNRFLNCCGRMRKKNEDEEINNNVKQLKKYKNNDNIQTCKSNVTNVTTQTTQTTQENNNDLNKDNQKEEVLNKAQEGCADCGTGCSKVCNCCSFFIVRFFYSIIDSCKSCFGCSDKKNK